MYVVDGLDRSPVKWKDPPAIEPLLAPTATRYIWYGVNSSAAAQLDSKYGGARLQNNVLRGKLAEMLRHLCATPN